jgi:hypothetical protein
MGYEEQRKACTAWPTQFLPVSYGYARGQRERHDVGIEALDAFSQESEAHLIPIRFLPYFAIFELTSLFFGICLSVPVNRPGVSR